jgi:hypothetical protein
VFENLPSLVSSAPMTYMLNGRQYIAVAVSARANGGDRGATLMARAKMAPFLREEFRCGGAGFDQSGGSGDRRRLWARSARPGSTGCGVTARTGAANVAGRPVNQPHRR